MAVSLCECIYLKDVSLHVRGCSIYVHVHLWYLILNAFAEKSTVFIACNCTSNLLYVYLCECVQHQISQMYYTLLYTNYSHSYLTHTHTDTATIKNHTLHYIWCTVLCPQSWLDRHNAEVAWIGDTGYTQIMACSHWLALLCFRWINRQISCSLHMWRSTHIP